jgi:hypothetical protein
VAWPYLVFAFVAFWAGATIVLDVREARRLDRPGGLGADETLSVADEAHAWLQQQR